MWQDSNTGNYIEFKIQVTYHEGHEVNRQSMHHSNNSVNESQSSKSQAPNEWIIYKRYSNFVDLHEVLVPFFQTEGLKVPHLPPKIANDATS